VQAGYLIVYLIARKPMEYGLRDKGSRGSLVFNGVVDGRLTLSDNDKASSHVSQPLVLQSIRSSRLSVQEGGTYQPATCMVAVVTVVNLPSRILWAQNDQGCARYSKLSQIPTLLMCPETDACYLGTCSSFKVCGVDDNRRRLFVTETIRASTNIVETTNKEQLCEGSH
jgi:hypothetical protein